jgi:hypothetical protein
MYKADTVIGTDQFVSLVLRRTRPGDVRRTVTQTHEDVYNDCYVKRLLAREAAQRLHNAGTSQYDRFTDRYILGFARTVRL